MKKIFLPITTLLFALTIAFPVATGAQKPAELPETPGTYNVPGNSKLKLRVFVYNAKNQGPSLNPALVQTCGLQDPNSSTEDGLAGWHLPSGNWTYRLNTASAPGTIGGANMVTLTANAYAEWATTDVGQKVNFARGSNTTAKSAKFDGQNIITWGRARSALAITYTWYYTDTKEAAEIDTIFNNRFAWAWAGDQTGCAYQGYYDAQNILTHELGHTVGLDDNYDDSFTNNTMFGYGSLTEVKKNTLADGDKAAVNSIY